MRCLLSLALLTSCARDVERAAEEARVYGAVVDEKGQATWRVADEITDYSFFAQGQAPFRIDEEAWQDLQSVAAEIGPAPMPLDMSADVKMVGAAGKPPILYFSRVGFDDRFQHAVLFVVTWHGEWGDLELVGLDWRNSHWKVTLSDVTGILE